MKLRGNDGVEIDIPTGETGLQGNDGRMVAIPKGKVGVQNTSGRMEANSRKTNVSGSRCQAR